MADLISAARGLGASERKLATLKTQRDYRKSITQDISSSLGQLANMADAKAVETENFQAGEKLLQESDSFQKIEDVTEFSWKNPKSWGKQEGYQYNDRQYDREQVMTLGESFKSYGGGFDESQKANLMSNWEIMNKDKSTFVGESKVGDSTESTYQKSLKRSNELGDKSRLLADRQDEFQKSGSTYIEPNSDKKEDDRTVIIDGREQTVVPETDLSRRVKTEQDEWRKKQHIETPILSNIDTSVNKDLNPDDQAWVDLEIDDKTPILQYQ